MISIKINGKSHVTLPEIQNIKAPKNGAFFKE